MPFMQVRVREDCEDCGGLGIIYFDHECCEACGRRVPKSWWDGDTDTMPCGHSARRFLADEKICQYCDGKGMIEKWLDWPEIVRMVKDG